MQSDLSINNSYKKWMIKGKNIDHDMHNMLLDNVLSYLCKNTPVAFMKSLSCKALFVNK